MRKFTGEELSQEDVVALLKAALMAPTSKRSNSWQFIAVDDKSCSVNFHIAKSRLRPLLPTRHWPLSLLPIPWRAMYGLRTLLLPLL